MDRPDPSHTAFRCRFARRQRNRVPRYLNWSAHALDRLRFADPGKSLQHRGDAKDLRRSKTASRSTSISNRRWPGLKRVWESFRKKPLEEIAKYAKIEHLDIDALARRTEVAGSPIIPIVEQLTARCGEHGQYLHWGATTQDLTDTATVIQIRDALAIVDADLRSDLRQPREAGAALLRHTHGRAQHVSTCGADHLRFQSCPGAGGNRAPSRTAHPDATASLGRPIWRRSGNARLTRNARARSSARTDEGTPTGRAGNRMAYASRQLRRGRQLPRDAHRHPREVRHRHQAHDADRGRGSVGACGGGTRWQQHHAAEAQPGGVQLHPRVRRDGAAERRIA